MGKNFFQLKAEIKPQGDQPQAIANICEAFLEKHPYYILLGVTGSGKTFTMANVINNLQRPTLIVAPNKTLAAQLFTEFKELFPDNAVEYFISYYDYFQPEAYMPSTDTYIAKDSLINDDIDKMRHRATMSLFERRDCIIVASVSCIYGLGSPDAYANLLLSLKVGDTFSPKKVLSKLVDIQYSRSDSAFERGTFRLRGDVLDVMPSHQREEAVRVEFFGDEIERISIIDGVTGNTIRPIDAVSIYPNSHYVTDRSDMKTVVREILTDLGVRLREYKAQGKFVEYQRLEQRTMHDIEMIEHLGFCPGIENYSRYLTGVPPGHPPPTLLDYFPKDFLVIMDESHITAPQFQGMHRGDRARKQVLVDFGFRLPSAFDNRPLNFDEFLERANQILFVSATPGPSETQLAQGAMTEQVIRPTGLVDPQIEIRPSKNQLDDLHDQCKQVIARGGRVLITTLTKRMAEDLTTYYKEYGLNIRYLHSDIDSLERFELLRDLRQGKIDILVGINLLREGLDLPEVQLVAVLDADKEGFLRSRSSLIQVVGRAARNIDGRVLFYADKITASMKQCIDETDRRRKIQLEYNRVHNIEPKTIIKSLPMDLRKLYGIVDPTDVTIEEKTAKLLGEEKLRNIGDIQKAITKKSKEMKKLAGKLDFEKAAELRNQIQLLSDAIMRIKDLQAAESVEN